MGPMNKSIIIFGIFGIFLISYLIYKLVNTVVFDTGVGDTEGGETGIVTCSTISSCPIERGYLYRTGVDDTSCSGAVCDIDGPDLNTCCEQGCNQPTSSRASETCCANQRAAKCNANYTEHTCGSPENVQAS